MWSVAEKKACRAEIVISNLARHRQGLKRTPVGLNFPGIWINM
jgi:hypothetical protein